MKNKIFNLKVNTQQKDLIRYHLKEIKKKNRYTYPEIIIMALKAYKAGLR